MALVARRAWLTQPEIGAPLVPNPWREINTMTVGFGHGLAITPLQLVNGVAAVVNGGVLALVLPKKANTESKRLPIH